jgi:hypothetical protein
VLRGRNREQWRAAHSEDIGKYKRRRGPRGQLPQLGLRDCRGLRNSLLNIRSRLQEHFDNRHSIERLRFDVLDVIDGSGKRSLCDAYNPVAHVLRDETVIVPDDADDWNVDIRENIGWGSNNRQHPQNQDENGHNHKRVGPF